VCAHTHYYRRSFMLDLVRMLDVAALQRTHTCQSNMLQIRRFFFGRQPLCGRGVHSWMLVMTNPAACSVLMDDCFPWPRPLTRSFTYGTSGHSRQHGA
jgi:hypothetical protein